MHFLNEITRSMKLVLKGPINQSHKSHYQPAPYLTIRNSEQKCGMLQTTMYLSHIPQYTMRYNFSVMNGVLWDTEQVHCWIYEIGALPKQMLSQSPDKYASPGPN